MIAIQPSINRAAQTLDVTIPAHGSHAAQTYSIPLTPPSDAELLTGLKVWRTITDAYIVTPPSHPLQLALSSFLNRDVLLVQKGPEFRQAGLPGYIDKIGFPTEYEEDGGPNTAFADGFPFLIATEPSMTDLRKRTVAAEDEKTIAGRRATGDAPLDLLRFRANIIVDGGIEPWEEDGWKEISAGEEGHRLHIAGRCGRCTVPEVDVETGQRQPFYPSAVLGTFRVVDGFVRLCHPSSSSTCSMICTGERESVLGRQYHTTTCGCLSVLIRTLGLILAQAPLAPCE